MAPGMHTGRRRLCLVISLMGVMPHSLSHRGVVYHYMPWGPMLPCMPQRGVCTWDEFASWGVGRVKSMLLCVYLHTQS